MTDPVFVRIRGTDRNLRFYEFLLFVGNKDTKKKISTVHFARFEHWSIVFQIQKKKNVIMNAVEIGILSYFVVCLI